MIPTRAFPLTVTWFEPNESTDEYADAVWTFDDDDEGVEIRAKIDHSTSSEERDGRDTLVSRWLLLTNELGITARARIIWDGKTYEIDGEPHTPLTPRGPHHLEAQLLLVEG